MPSKARFPELPVVPLGAPRRSAARAEPIGDGDLWIAYPGEQTFHEAMVLAQLSERVHGPPAPVPDQLARVLQIGSRRSYRPERDRGRRSGLSPCRSCGSSRRPLLAGRGRGALRAACRWRPCCRRWRRTCSSTADSPPVKFRQDLGRCRRGRRLTAARPPEGSKCAALHGFCPGHIHESYGGKRRDRLTIDSTRE